MGEEFLNVVPSDREVEQAIVALKKGAHLLKYNRRGKPKFCPFRLSSDEKFLIWYSGQEEKQLRLISVADIVRGQKTKQLQPERESQSFSLIHSNGEQSLNLICKDKAQADTWFLGLRAVISRSHPPRSLVTSINRRGAQSCVNSPAGFMRRKHNLGLLEETTKSSQVHSLYGSPTQSFSERCFSDGLSCSSDSFYSESSLPIMKNVKDLMIPNSPYTEPDGLKKRGAIPCTKIQNNVFNRFITHVHESSQVEKNVLRDVFVWGEGIEGGCLGGSFNKIGNHNGMPLDALLPKLLESTMMLDVRKISLGAKHAALVTKQGEVFCWGEGKQGRLGHKVDMDIAYPKVVDSLTEVHVKSVVCSEYQTCVVTLSGEIYAWGDNYYGADLAGKDSYRSQWLPYRLSGPWDGIVISNVACGEWHTTIVSSSGQLFTCGDGTFGVLGHGNLQSVSQPKEVESLKGLRVKSVACGPWHTAAIVEIMVDHSKSNDRGGKLFTWGDGDKGRLGHADQELKLTPTCVAPLVDHDFVQVSCGRMLTVGLTNTGMVYTMGSAVHGQLGNPQSRDKSIANVQGKLKHEFVREISSGSYHIVALTSSGNVYMWGKGANGQLGLGDTEDRNSPSLVEALTGRQVESITCGSSSTAAICLHKSISGADQLACRGCSMAFGFTRKKHNCYNCGLLFCRACTSKKVTNASLAPKKSKPVRVCNPCFNQLSRTAHCGKPSKMDNLSPRPLIMTQKAFSDGKEDGEETTTTPSRMTSMKNCGDENSMCHEMKTMKNDRGNWQNLDSISSFSGGLPRWGQVPCPLLFRKQTTEHPKGNDSAMKNQFSTVSQVCLQEVTQESTFSASSAVNVKKDFLDSDTILVEEAQKLRAEAESLDNLCKMRKEKIQECELRIEEAWSLAKEEAAKCKAAKEVIKSLTTRLHTMSEKISAGGEAKGQVSAILPQMTSLCKNSPTLKGLHPVLTATHAPPEVGDLEDRNFNTLCSSPIVFSNTLLSMRNRDTNSVGPKSAEESCARRTDPGQTDFKAMKLEWVEQYQAGVYITFIHLPSGQKGLKRVRFSRRRYTEKEAKRWWEENQQEVYQKLDIEGYMSSHDNMMKR